MTSVADYVKRIHRELNDGRSEANVIPSDAGTIAQELFVFTLGGDGRHELERLVASDFSRAQITVKLQAMSSDLVLQEVEAADRRAKEIFAGTGVTVLTTGSGRLFSTLDHYLVMSQLSSFATAFVTVFGVIFVVFRSFRFGLLTIVPNVLPVVAVLGVMGYLGISMNIATVMVASVALGVVDDDTIHFINRYRREVAAGASTDEAIETATAHEGRASLTTAIINSCGYGVLLLSEYKPTAWFGGLLALTMAVAFLAEVLILPATIKLLPGWLGAEALRKRRGAAAAAMVVLCLLVPGVASAQSVGRPSGNASLTTDYEPNRHDTVELRGRLFAEEKIEISPSLRVTASGFVEGLVASRPTAPDLVTGETRNTTVTDAVVRVHDAFAELTIGRLDLRAGFARVVWGRLDEMQPTDVVNPLDVSRFFFEGRSEARLPVALIRAQPVPLGSGVDRGGVRPGLPSRPLRSARRANVTLQPRGAPRRRDCRLPGDRLSHAASGDRRRRAIGWRGERAGGRPLQRDDRPHRLGASRRTGGREPFAIYQIGPSAPGAPPLIQGTHPRFTMIGGDVETVRGEWGIRGEVAAFVDDNFQAPSLFVLDGTSFDAGIGVDRRAGDYRISGTVLYHRERMEQDLSLQLPAEGTTPIDTTRSDLSLVLSADRRFARERYALRVFGVATPSEGSGFARAIASAELRDNLALEGSVGWFIGEGRDLVGRFSDSDFGYLRLKYYF